MRTKLMEGGFRVIRSLFFFRELTGCQASIASLNR